jgi:hypothetical protein
MPDPATIAHRLTRPANALALLALSSSTLMAACHITRAILAHRIPA